VLAAVKNAAQCARRGGLRRFLTYDLPATNSKAFFFPTGSVACSHSMKMKEFPVYGLSSASRAWYKP
jgi:hypothetical protein